LGIPASLTGEFFQEFVEGFVAECQNFGMPLVGGDLSRSQKVVISVTVWGCLGESPVYRSAARAGDYLLLIGEVGFSRLGLEWLREHGDRALGRISSKKELRRAAGVENVYQWLKAHLLPEIQLGPALWLREQQLAGAMIDVSDGVGRDVSRLLVESRLSCELRVDKLPLPAGLEEAERAWEYALDGGEDYALLVTVSPQQLECLKLSYPEEFPRFHVIGRLSSGPSALTLADDRGQIKEYDVKGFDHFR
jgi:thiamine-monophosphate kinase